MVIMEGDGERESERAKKREQENQINFKKDI